MTAKSFKQYKTIRYDQSEFKSLSGLWKVERIILDAIDFKQLTNKVVNIILTELNYLELGYQIIVLTLLDTNKKYIKRIAISKTEASEKALQETPIPFKQITIPHSTRDNLLVRTIKEKKVYFTHDLSDVLYPAGNRDEWRRIQQVCQIKTSMVFPVVVRDEAIGAMIFSLSKGINEISKYEKEVLAGFTNAVGLAVEHASLYQRLKQINRHLHEVSALKDEFVSLTSHELRTPMTAIAGTLSTVLDGYVGKISTDTRDFLKGAKNEVDRLLRMVNNLLNISRIESGRLRYEITGFPSWPLVKKVVENILPLAEEKGLTVSCLEPIGTDDIKIKADKDKVEEVLNNLIGNSIKYTDKGYVKVGAEVKGKETIFFVTDNGLGIPEKDQKELFQKFYRATKGEKKAKGTGLGLYISKIMVEGMGGKIWSESKVGKGSTFFFSLPTQKAD
jgi:signal transduction histidine kinase